jgi:hypothetical protein
LPWGRAWSERCTFHRGVKGRRRLKALNVIHVFNAVSKEVFQKVQTCALLNRD